MNTRTLIITFVWMIMSNIVIFAQEHWDAQERIELNKGVFPKNFSKAIDIIQYDLLGIERGKSHVKVIDNNTLYPSTTSSNTKAWPRISATCAPRQAKTRSGRAACSAACRPT